MDKGHLQTSEKNGAKTHSIAPQQVEDVFEDGKSATDGCTADDAVDEEHDFLAAGQPKKRDAFDNLFYDGVDGIRLTFGNNLTRQLEQGKTGQRCQHTT